MIPSDLANTTQRKTSWHPVVSSRKVMHMLIDRIRFNLNQDTAQLKRGQRVDSCALKKPLIRPTLSMGASSGESIKRWEGLKTCYPAPGRTHFLVYLSSVPPCSADAAVLYLRGRASIVDHYLLVTSGWGLSVFEANDDIVSPVVYRPIGISAFDQLA